MVCCDSLIPEFLTSKIVILHRASFILHEFSDLVIQGLFNFRNYGNIIVLQILAQMEKTLIQMMATMLRNGVLGESPPVRNPQLSRRLCPQATYSSGLQRSAKVKIATEHAHTLFWAKFFILGMLSSHFGFAEVATSLHTAVSKCPD